MNLILLVIALLCFLVAGLSDFGWLLSADHLLGWVAFGLFFFACFVASGPVVTFVKERRA